MTFLSNDQQKASCCKTASILYENLKIKNIIFKIKTKSSE